MKEEQEEKQVYHQPLNPFYREGQWWFYDEVYDTWGPYPDHHIAYFAFFCYCKFCLR